jgi:hypothetical protein
MPVCSLDSDCKIGEKFWIGTTLTLTIAALVDMKRISKTAERQKGPAEQLHHSFKFMGAPVGPEQCQGYGVLDWTK